MGNIELGPKSKSLTTQAKSYANAKAKEYALGKINKAEAIRASPQAFREEVARVIDSYSLTPDELSAFRKAKLAELIVSSQDPDTVLKTIALLQREEQAERTGAFDGSGGGVTDREREMLEAAMKRIEEEDDKEDKDD